MHPDRFRTLVAPFTLILLAALATLPASAVAQGGKKLTSLKERASYAIGLNIGNSLKKQQVDIDIALIQQGLKDGVTGNKPRLSNEEIRLALTELRANVEKSEALRRQKSGSKSMEEGKIFLANNKKKKDVVTTKSGLQYRVIAPGKGKSPTASDTVTTHYKGTLINGTQFDSSYDRGEPASFPVKGVIAGWTEALQLMKPGAKWELVIPAHLAYGERGAGRDIPPNAVLVFQIELISIK